MPLSDEEIRSHFVEVVMSRVNAEADRRKEALLEYFGLTLPGVSTEEKDCLAQCIPTVLPSLYRRWAFLCAARLLQAVPRNQLEHLCDGSAANEAALVLVFIMFLESERMEKQMDEDLKAYGQAHSGAADLGVVAADFIRSRMAGIKAALQPEGGPDPGRK